MVVGGGEGPYLDCHLSRKLDGYEVGLRTIGAEKERKDGLSRREGVYACGIG